ncbi:FecR family protein [bacterium A37T11]|nr:FecR family protein [bacterium A37T11]
MDEKYIAALIDRYKKGTCTPEEAVLVESLHIHTYTPQGNPINDAAKMAVWARLNTKNPFSIKKRMLWAIPSVAALLLVAFGLFLKPRKSTSSTTQPIKTADIHPGYNQATITLADGSKISLDSAKAGIRVNDERIEYQSGELIKSVILSGERRKEEVGAEGSLPTSISLSTPKGGQYQIVLSDGTIVWLNAATTLKYPSKFSGNRREVELEGEAFFDVAQMKSKPFIVRSKGQQIDVMGTTFNLRAYAEDGSEITTLVSGSIQVRSQDTKQNTANTRLLKPTEQASVNNGEIIAKQVDVQEAISWKLGFFFFKNTPFSTVMNQIGRWYDLDIVYNGEIPKKTFSGKMKRDVSLASVLKFLDGSGIRFQVDGNKLVID